MTSLAACSCMTVRGVTICQCTMCMHAQTLCAMEVIASRCDTYYSYHLAKDVRSLDPNLDSLAVPVCRSRLRLRVITPTRALLRSAA